MFRGSYWELKLQKGENMYKQILYILCYYEKDVQFKIINKLEFQGPTVPWFYILQRASSSAGKGSLCSHALLKSNWFKFYWFLIFFSFSFWPCFSRSRPIFFRVLPDFFSCLSQVFWSQQSYFWSRPIFVGLGKVLSCPPDME